MSAYEWAEKDRLDRLANQEFWDKTRKIKIARNLLNMNLSFEQIAQATELSLSEIEALAVAR